jgi:uncharacterized protein (DUF1800 family)
MVRGYVAYRLLIITLVALLICEDRVVLARPAIKITPQEQANLLEISNKFDGKKVVCNRRPNGKVLGGRLFEKKGKYSWKSLDTLGKELKAKKKPKKAEKYRNAHRQYQVICRSAWETAKRPLSHSQNVSLRRRSTAAITLGADGPGEIVFQIKSQPAHGTLSGSVPNLSYTPEQSFAGSDSFTFTATANGYESAPATVSITVEYCGLSADSSTVEVSEGRSIDLLLTARDTCQPESPLSFAVTQAPTQGSLQEAFPRVVYAPRDHLVTSDSLRFRVTNEIGETAEATVTFAVTAGASEFAGNPQLLGRYRESLSESEVHSVLDRVAFGGTETQREIRSLSALVDSLLEDAENPNLKSFYDGYDVNRLNRATSAPASYNARWFFGDVQVLAADQLRHGNPFRAWMAMGFWHNLFTSNLTEWSNSGNSNFMPEYVQRLQRHALGNYRDFLEDMLSDGIFHLYLNNFDNTYLEPNENFGREFLELYTAGVEDPITKEPTYSEVDVVSSTRALSGFGYASGTVLSGSRDSGSTLPTPQGVRASDAAFFVNPQTQAVTYQTWVMVNFTPIRSSTATQIVLERAPYGTNTFAQAAIVTYSNSSGTIYDYTPATGAPYHYRVRLRNAQGVLGTPSTSDIGHAGYPGTLPTNPSSIAATAGSSSAQVQVTWSAVPGVIGYQILRNAYDDGARIQLSPVLNAATLSFTDTQVLPNKIYRYEVLSVMPGGVVGQRNYRDTAVFGTDYVHGYYRAPTSSLTSPARVLATSTSTTGVSVSWEPAPGASSYRVFRYPEFTDLYSSLGDVSAGQLSFTDTSASPGARYGYMVRSLDGFGRIAPAVSAGFNPLGWNQSASQMTPLSFLSTLDPASPNAAGKIDFPGVPMSARGWSFQGSPSVTSFVDHVLYNWPAPRRQLAAKLIAHITHRELSEELVSAVAQSLLENDFEIKPALRLILSSSAMFAPEAHNTCVKSPLEAYFSFVRKTNLPATTADTRNRYISRISPTGYSPLNPPSVFGWKNCGVVRSGIVEDGSAWALSSQTYIALGNGISGTISDATVPVNHPYPGEGLNVLEFFVPEGSSAQAGVVVDRMAATLGVNISAAQRALLIEYLNTNDSGVASPFNGASHTSRVTGLLRMLTMSVEFLTK